MLVTNVMHKQKEENSSNPKQACSLTIPPTLSCHLPTDSRMYTEEAERLIAGHDVSKRFYLYLAFHNVHVPIQFPRATAERYPHVITDSRKGTDAMLTELG